MSDRALSTWAVPIPRTRLVGRETERASARALLLDEAAPLLTLTGPGGVGKTRLALAIAHDVRDRFADGEAWIDLAALEDPSLVPLTVCVALGLTPAPDRPLLDDLVRHLHARQMLLVVDNCEHVLADIADLLSTLIARCPALQVLATSRAPLRIRDERVFVVDPLTLPTVGDDSLERLTQNAAIALFTERARAMQPSFQLTETNAPAVATICRHLDGLPLAIELAAARLSILSVDALLVQVGDRLQLVHDGPRDLPARQRTVEAAIAWSYALLPPDAQALFCRLAVFVGSFSLEAVQAVAPGSQEATSAAIPGFQLLIEHSLVRRRGEPDEARFEMLETIRAVGLQKLAESSDDEHARDAHADYVARLAEVMEEQLADWRKQRLTLALLEQQTIDIQAAIAWLRFRGQPLRALQLSTALWRYWWLREDKRAGRQLLEELVAEVGPADLALRAKALNGLGVLADDQEDYEQAQRHHIEALRLFRELGDLHGVAWSLNNLGVVELNQGHLEEAQVLLEENLAVAEQVGAEASIATALNDLGQIAHYRGDHERAIELLKRGLERFRALGDNTHMARALNNLGTIKGEYGDLDAACDLLAESLALHQALDDQQGIASTLNNLAQFTGQRGDTSAASAMFHESYALAMEHGNKLYAGIAMENLASLLRRSGDATTAHTHYREALQLYRSAEDLQGINSCVIGLSSLVTDAETAKSAARLLGAMVHLRENRSDTSPGAPPVQESWDELDKESTRLRAILGDTVFAAAWESGQGMRLDTLVADALTLPVAQVAELGLDRSSPQTGPFHLTRRELEVLALIGQRLTNKEVAEHLFIGARTVQTHTISIFTKLGVDNRRDAAALALRYGLA